jgi:VWFA-related protein
MKTITALIFTLSLVLFSIDVRGQDEDKLVRIETELVSVNVAVADGNGKPVLGLTQSHFQIFDDRVEQRIEHFSNVSSGVSFGIVYDMHPTTHERTNAVLNGLREFKKSLPAADDLFVVVFNERGCLVLDFVPDSDQLARHLARPAEREPRSLYDALYFAAGKLREQKNLKKTLLVVTDAADHNSRRTFNELRDNLKRFDVQVYAIMLDETLSRFEGYVDLTKTPETFSRVRSDATPSDRAALNSIALRSGGATFPSSLANAQNIFRISQQIATEMHNQYTIGFYPAGSRDGKWHTLRIGLKGVPGSNKFVLTYRPGYETTIPTRP